MAQRPDLDFDDQDPMPEGWSPEADADRQWHKMVALMREADDPVLPSRDQFDRIGAAIRSELRGARVPEATVPVRKVAAPPTDESFLAWLRQVLFGGGVGAQAFRLACAGALAFGVGYEWQETPPPPATSTAPEKPDASLPDAAPSVAVSHFSAPQVRPVAGSSEVVERETPRDDVGFFGGVLSRSGIDEGGRLKPLGQTTSDLGWSSTLPAEGGWEFAADIPRVGRRAAATDSAGYADAGTRQYAQDLLGHLKFRSLMEGDASASEQLRRLESALEPFLAGGPEAPSRTSMNEAEDLAARGRWEDAIDSFREAGAAAPRTFQAFLAEYRIAQIQYENLEDYESALASYRRALDEYPAHFLGQADKHRLEERIALLSENGANNWIAVRLWEKSRHATRVDRVDLLARLLYATPTVPLAADAARELVDHAVDQAVSHDVDARELVKLLDHALAEASQSPHAAALAYAKGDLLARRLLDFNGAREAYLAALRLPGASQYDGALHSRLKDLPAVR